MKERIQERILVEVHMSAVRRWAEEDGIPTARGLVVEIEKARGEYKRIVSVEGDLWEPEWNPRNATFSWQEVCQNIGIGNQADIVGAQTNLCVRKAHEELSKRGFDVWVRGELTIDLGNNL